MPHPNSLTMVREALKEKAPDLYRQLEANSQTEAFVTQKAEELEEQRARNRDALLEKHRPLNPNLKAGYLTRVQNLNQIESIATEQAMATVLDFPNKGPAETIESPIVI